MNCHAVSHLLAYYFAGLGFVVGLIVGLRLRKPVTPVTPPPKA